MLKLATEAEERFGAMLMDWWGGDGAARVLARDDDALLLERAEGTASLADMARNRRDDEACRVLCAVADRLHAPRPEPLPELVPLKHWFRELEPAAATHGGILACCAETAHTLLGEPREVGVLHGDLHHGNVLDFGVRGWLAIDPKGLLGERGFDFANIFTNPDLADPTRPVATEPGRFMQRLEVVVAAARLERRRLLRWILAWTGLSAAWLLSDGA
jgi:streptomycin 6-kinase